MLKFPITPHSFRVKKSSYYGQVQREIQNFEEERVCKINQNIDTHSLNETVPPASDENDLLYTTRIILRNDIRYTARCTLFEPKHAV
mmetsp:Transcript_21843/g.26702  ORF Transcript_21843/g.26702 Transcript_21843/m.26702 type:complete len:87 (+) Transcript_21843:144-404(+)